VRTFDTYLFKDVPVVTGILQCTQLKATKLWLLTYFTRPRTGKASWLQPSNNNSSAITTSQYPPTGRRSRLLFNLPTDGQYISLDEDPTERQMRVEFMGEYG
jgi:hypothetical protein